MFRLRFNSAHEVYSAFPTARGDVGVDMPDDTPPRFMESLARSATPASALAFCAYMLPRREAVWWGCKGLRAILPALSGKAPEPFKAAEAWVRRPDDATRRIALNLGMNGDLAQAPAWLALAAGWAGGSMTLSEHAVPAPPHLTAKAVNASLILALAREPAAGRPAAVLALVAIGLRLAGGEETL